jgi:hypothetical protein
LASIQPFSTHEASPLEQLLTTESTHLLICCHARYQEPRDSDWPSHVRVTRCLVRSRSWGTATPWSLLRGNPLLDFIQIAIICQGTNLQSNRRAGNSWRAHLFSTSRTRPLMLYNLPCPNQCPTENRIGISTVPRTPLLQARIASDLCHAKSGSGSEPGKLTQYQHISHI